MPYNKYKKGDSGSPKYKKHMAVIGALLGVFAIVFIAYSVRATTSYFSLMILDEDPGLSLSASSVAALWEVPADKKIQSKPIIVISANECSKNRLIVTSRVRNMPAIVPTSCVNIGTSTAPWDISTDQILGISPDQAENIQIRCDTYPQTGFGSILSNRIIRHEAESSQCRQKKNNVRSFLP